MIVDLQEILIKINGYFYQTLSFFSTYPLKEDCNSQLCPAHRRHFAAADVVASVVGAAFVDQECSACHHSNRSAGANYYSLRWLGALVRASGASPDAWPLCG